MVTVVFPQQFSKILDGQLKLSGPGASLREVLANICDSRADLRKLLFLETGEVSPFIGFSLLGADSFYSSKMIAAVPLKTGDSVEVILSMAGG
jgi:hypothetical protein